MIDADDTLESLEKILEKAEETKSSTNADPTILDSRNKFYKEFVKRIRSFVSTIMGPDLDISSKNSIHFNTSML